MKFLIVLGLIASVLMVTEGRRINRRRVPLYNKSAYANETETEEPSYKPSYSTTESTTTAYPSSTAYSSIPPAAPYSAPVYRKPSYDAPSYSAPATYTTPAYEAEPAYVPTIAPSTTAKYPTSYIKDDTYDNPRPFRFAYAVKDEATYNDYSHQQESDGKVVTGSYRVLLPDGRTQVVTYKADDYGYVADVKYEGEAKIDDYKANSYQTSTTEPSYQPAASAYQVPDAAYDEEPNYVKYESTESTVAYPNSTVQQYADASNDQTKYPEGKTETVYAAPAAPNYSIPTNPTKTYNEIKY